MKVSVRTGQKQNKVEELSWKPRSFNLKLETIEDARAFYKIAEENGLTDISAQIEEWAAERRIRL